MGALLLVVGLLGPQGWAMTPVTTARCSRAGLASSVVCMKNAAAVEDDADRPQLPSIAAGSIVEFHDNYGGEVVPILGIVDSCEHKAKGGIRVMIMDAAGKMHSVTQKALHIVLPPAKSKKAEPAEVLKDYAAVMEETSAEELVEPELLELAWSVCAEDSREAFTPNAILSIIDDSMCKTPLDAYKAFRLITSDLGKVFFKGLGDNTYKAKVLKAVDTSKANWCRVPDHQARDFCFG